MGEMCLMQASTASPLSLRGEGPGVRGVDAGRGADVPSVSVPPSPLSPLRKGEGNAGIDSPTPNPTTPRPE